MLHLSARLHAFINELGRPSPQQQARRLHSEITQKFRRQQLLKKDDREQLAIDIAQEVIDSFEATPPLPD